MALIIKRDMQLVRLLDSRDDNPLELTMGATGDGRVVVHLEDRDVGTQTKSVALDLRELRAALAMLDVTAREDSNSPYRYAWHIED